MIYLDNAATSWPKPPGVIEAIRDWMEFIGGNPGRSGHRLSASAARSVFTTRENLAQLLGVRDSRQLIFTPNATFAINTVIQGMLSAGDHVVVTGMEHNAVMRPLHWMAEKHGVRVEVVSATREGVTGIDELVAALRPDTRLVIVNHASNVTGTIAPVAQISQAIGDVPLLVDAAQTAGVMPIDVEIDGIDLLACTGHKGLLGPTGTGCLYIRPGLEERIQPLIRGGTGSRSDSAELPEVLPDRFESGTSNAAGIAGLGAGIKYLQQLGIENIRQHEITLTARLLDGLHGIAGAVVYGPADATLRTAVVAFNIAGVSPSDIGLKLDHNYNIMTRVGLHCAPQAHRAIGTFPQGAIRISAGIFTTAAEIDAAIAALREIAAKAAA